jgi:hypothetical protein
VDGNTAGVVPGIGFVIFGLALCGHGQRYTARVRAQGAGWCRGSVHDEVVVNL